ncbi:MAG: thiol reductant ABC exporter subunit CydD, partial [Oscillochloris sp.]|nr:thiol reductant ABC exporter subunit CydD [Oscillochloris sp.]
MFPKKDLLAADRRARLWLWATIGAGGLGAAAAVGMAALLASAIGRVFLAGAGLREVGPALAGVAGLATLRALLVWLGELCGQRLASRVKQALRQQLVADLLERGPAYSAGERSGELATTLVEGVEALDEYLSQYVPQMTLAGLAPLIVLAFVLPTDLLSGLVLLCTAPLIPLFMWLIGTQAQEHTARRWGELGRMSAHFLDTLQGLTTLKLFGRSREQLEGVAAISARFGELTLEVLRIAFLSSLALELIASLSTAVLAVEIALRLMYGRMEFAPALTLLILAPEFYLPLRLLGQRHHAAMAGKEALRRIGEVAGGGGQGATGEGQATGSEDAQPVASGHPLPASGLHIRSLTYAYAEGARPALRGVDLELPAGQTLALAGPNGAGKTTLAWLLLGFLTPDAGEIWLSGRRLAATPLPEWRRQLAWVSQHPALFAGSVAENLRLARPTASDAELERAARAAGAHDVIMALPQGYQTPIGAGGARLSGGQRQRLAIARALLKDAPLVIFDEATAHLDPQSEAEVQAGLRSLLHGRSALVIAHSPRVLAEADLVVRMEAGRVVGEQSGGPPIDVRAQQQPSTMLGEQTCMSGAAAAPLAGCAATEGADGRPALRRLLALVRPYWRSFALALLLGFATVGSSVGLMATSAFLIAQSALMPSIALLNVPIVGVRFFGIARGLFRYAERYVSHRATFQLLAGVRSWFFATVEPLAPAGLIDRQGGDLLARAVGDVETLEQLYLRVLSPPLVALLVALLTAGILLAFGARLALALLAVQLLAGVLLPLLIRRFSRHPAGVAVAERAGLLATLVEAIQGMPDLLALGAEQALLARVRGQSAALALAQERLAGLRGLANGLVGLLSQLAALAVLLLAIPLVRGGQIDGVYLALLALTSVASFEALTPLATALQSLELSLAAARRLFAIADTPAQIAHEPERSPAPQDAAVEFAGVSFTYPGADRPVLRDVRTRVAPGQRLLIVGPSGIGKSTLTSLLLRFWEGYTGSIRVGGHDLRAYRAEDVRRMIGVVAQETHLFQGTVLDNLRLARPEASEAEIALACRRARFDQVLARLPESYATWLGERGVGLSGGERQRLAIARALLKDAPILVLDEPTAHLDAEAEREVLAALAELQQGRTTLLISHRPEAQAG